MISFADNSEPGRVIKNAVLDDISPLPSGTDFEYWRGETDFEPRGRRLSAFIAARTLENRGRIVLYQKCMGEGDYSYRARVM